MYSSPASRAASAIAAIVVLAVGLGACACAGRRADRRDRSGGAALRAAAASISPRASRSSGGIQARPSACVDLLLASRRRRARRPSMRNSPYSFSLKPQADGAIAQRDVVRLRAGEVLHRGAAAVGGTSRRSAWKPPRQQHARLGVAVRRARARRAGSRRTRPSATASAPDGEDVDVAAGVAAAAQAADRRRSSASGARSLQVARRAPAAVVVRVGQQVAAGVALPFLERLEDQRFLLRAHALERADAAVGRGAARDRRACGCRARGRASPRSSGPTPCRCSRSRIVGGKLGDELAVILRRRRSRRSRGCAPRGPCRCRESRAARRRRASASSCGWLATMSAPLR